MWALFRPLPWSISLLSSWLQMDVYFSWPPKLSKVQNSELLSSGCDWTTKRPLPSLLFAFHSSSDAPRSYELLFHLFSLLNSRICFAWQTPSRLLLRNKSSGNLLPSSNDVCSGQWSFHGADDEHIRRKRSYSWRRDSRRS